MAYDFHSDKERYFQQQRQNATDFVIPFIEQIMPINQDTKVLEIGCGEGGVLQALVDSGATGVGVELSAYRVEYAESFMAESIAAGKATIINKNIFDLDFTNEYKHHFNLIILKDVIEHIHGQEKLLEALRQILTPTGYIFFGFPPWQMPFGGHQQIANSKIASTLPFYHLLPTGMYKALLKAFGEQQRTIDDLIEIKETGISLERFERIVRRTQYQVVEKTLFLINPIYKYKFGLTPRKQLPILGNIPILKNFWTTCAYYLIQPTAT